MAEPRTEAHARTHFAVMSAMLLSRTKLRLNTERVEPLAIHARPLMELAREPSSRKYCAGQGGVCDVCLFGKGAWLAWLEYGHRQ